MEYDYCVGERESKLRSHPQNWNYGKPSSKMNQTARHAAKVSRTETEDGKGIFSDRSAVISPQEFRTTTWYVLPTSLQTQPLQNFFFQFNGGQEASKQAWWADRFWRDYSSLLKFLQQVSYLVEQLIHRNSILMNFDFVSTIPH